MQSETVTLMKPKAQKNNPDNGCSIVEIHILPLTRFVLQRLSRSSPGYTLIEQLFVLATIAIMTAMAIPNTLSAITSYQLTAAVDSATGAIQGTRYLAIMHGYPYQVAFNATQNTFQVSNEVPPATSFSNVGSAVPLSGSPITLSAASTFQFKPNGSVSAAVGPMSFSISYKGTTKTLTVSNYGSINVQ